MVNNLQQTDTMSTEQHLERKLKKELISIIGSQREDIAKYEKILRKANETIADYKEGFDDVMVELNECKQENFYYRILIALTIIIIGIHVILGLFF